MKAVIFHADGHYGERHGLGIYKDLTLGLKKNCEEYNIELIHLTVTGHEGWGHHNYYYDVNDINEVIYNREKICYQFLKNDAVDDEVYWFCEPDFRMIAEYPPVTTDLCLLYRNDPVAITPAWKICKKTAWPFLEEAFSYFDMNYKKWHGDSPAWVRMWENMGKPTEIGIYEYKGLSVELRPYGWYASRHKKQYSGQWKGGSKMQIVSDEYRKFVEENPNAE